MACDRLSDLCVLHCHQERVDEEKANQILATIMAGEKQWRNQDFRKGGLIHFCDYD